MFLAASTAAQYQVRKPSAVTPASIQVTGPVGGETWEKGKRYDITWTSTGIRGGSVKIELVDGSGKATALVRQTLNNGKYSFSLMAGVVEGDYRVRVGTVDGQTSGESAGTVHIGKTSGAVATPSAPAAAGLKPTAYSPRKPETPATGTATTPPPAGTSQPAAVAGHATVTAPDVVRHDFNAVEVPVATLRTVRQPSIIPTSTIQPQTPDMKLLPSMIDVTDPVAGDVWQAGEQHTIRWVSHDLDGPVKIDLINATRGDDDQVHYTTLPVAASTENDGEYEYTVPERLGCHSRYFVSQVASIDGRTTDKSPEYFDVYTEPIDMVCQVVDLKQRQDTDWYVLYSERDKWLEFDVWLRNDGTQRDVTVQTVLVTIIKQPEELVVAQEEWGFSGINPQRWYSTPEPRKFDISSEGTSIVYDFKDVDLENGAYRVEVEVDPDNQLNENPVLRDNNKFVRYFEIK